MSDFASDEEYEAWYDEQRAKMLLSDWFPIIVNDDEE